MTWYPDGSPYEYGSEPEPGLVCAGWLGRGHPFRRGEPPPGFLDRLAWRCVNQLDRAYRGIHHCELCQPGEATFVSVLHEGGKLVLGCAEITLEAGSTTYAVPNLVLHYVAAHGYHPPDDFVAALMSGPPDESLSDWRFHHGPYWTRET